MKYTISVSKTYKHRGSFRHKHSTKRHWFRYFIEIEDGIWKLGCESINSLQAWFYKSRKYHRRIIYCSNCFARFRVLTKSKAKVLEFDCSNCGA